MKVAILTFHKAPNYGAMLQAYALQEAIQMLGHTPFIADFWPYDTYSLLRRSSLRSFKCILRELLLLKVKLNRKRSFLSFANNHFHLISVDLNVENNDVDAFVIGSDQLWNSKIVKQPVYWGDSVAMRNKLLISYAVSAGNDASRGTLWGEQFLGLFDKIGVREFSLHECLKQKGFNNSIVLDPTLLHSHYFYTKIQKEPKQHPKRYVLIYQVMLDELSYNFAQAIANKYNIEVIEIAAGNRLRKDKHIVKSASPEEFLWYIDNAEIIITTSFHGTVFSIIYHKDFYVIDSTCKNDSRITSLLSITGLTHRRISSMDDQVGSHIDWDGVDKAIAYERERSISYLRDSLSSNQRNDSVHI